MSSVAKVCVIIPAYNEENAIADVIRGIKKTLNKAKISHEVVVINDGSSDRTSKKAAAAGAKVINHILNTGSGGATSTGLRYALLNNATYAATIDADGQHHPEDLAKGLSLIKNINCDSPRR